MEINGEETASETLFVTEEVVIKFSEISQDKNPVHLDEKFAASTRFGQRIAHGMLSAALISSVIGNKLPGNGTIYLSQTLSFRAPVFIGDTITASVSVLESMGRNRFRLATTVARQDGQIVVDGEAEVLKKTDDFKT